MSKTLLILGGYGNTGRAVSELLLKETDVQLIIAGRNKNKAKAFASSLNEKFKAIRVFGMQADAADPLYLKKAFEKADCVVVTSSSSDYTEIVVQEVLEAGIDYLDVQYSGFKIDVLKSFNKAIEDSGRCFITDGGFHPGIPAALVRYAAAQFDDIKKATTGCVLRLNWNDITVADDTIREMVREIRTNRSVVYVDGDWVTGIKYMKQFNFGKEYGEFKCYPMFLDEQMLSYVFG